MSQSHILAQAPRLIAERWRHDTAKPDRRRAKLSRPFAAGIIAEGGEVNVPPATSGA